MRSVHERHSIDRAKNYTVRDACDFERNIHPYADMMQKSTNQSRNLLEAVSKIGFMCKSGLRPLYKIHYSSRLC